MAEKTRTRRNPNKRSKPKVTWLIMLYFAGDNSLTEEMVLALQDLQAEGPPNRDKIVAQLDPSGAGLSAQRFDLSAARPGKKLEDYRDRTFAGETNTGSEATLVNFIIWAHNKYPRAQRRFLILSGHGSGTTEDFLMKDESANDSLTIDELTNALARARQETRTTIDILGMDACYMSMGEVAFHVREHVGFMIGAEGLEPAFGWPYRRILRMAKEYRHSHPRSVVEPRVLAKRIVEEYIEHYSDYDRTAGRSTDMAAIDLGQIGELEQKFKALVGMLRALDGAGHDQLVLAHWYAQTYKYEQFVDLRDLCDQIRKRLGSAAISEACKAVMDAVDGCVVQCGCSGFAYQHSHGLSIYFPWSFISPDYRSVEFGRTTGWSDFLTHHVTVTRRRHRGGFAPVDVKGLVEECWATAQRRGPIKLDPDDAARTAIIQTMKRLMRLPQVGRLAAERRLARAVARVKRADIAPEDVPGELLRRVVRAGAVRDANSRHTNNTRHTDHTRSLDDREKLIKNLPPVVGKAYVQKPEPRV
jgi:hypothetical protein